ncbi:hypothetical protein ACP4OV_013224 [Aristida adscensionis]
MVCRTKSIFAMGHVDTGSRTAFLFLLFLAFSIDPTVEESVPKSIISTVVAQPSLQHPLLKNHTVQMQPGSYLYDFAGDGLKKSSNPSVKMSKIECPPRTMPILRSYYNGSTADRPINIIKGNNWDQNDRRGKIAAVATVTSTFYASQSEISVWEPDVGTGNPPRFSGAIMTMQNGVEPTISAVYAGWFVDPHLYGDNRVHFEVGWFSKNTVPGAQIEHVSKTNGDQYYIKVSIYQDQRDGNWWSRLDDEFVGYWSKELFKYMHDAASMAGWVGVAAAAGGESYPPNGQW